MEFIIALAMKFWQWSLLILFVIIGFAINLLDKRKTNNLKFSYTELPHLQHIPIKTNLVILKDFEYTINGTNYVIPKGFSFDGASIPKFLRTFFSPVGVLLIGGLVHDYMYKYAACKPADKKGQLLLVDQKRSDEIFRDINIEVNGFYFMNYLAYWSLRLGGFVAWNGHRKRNAKIK
jgi:hypothetical protein